MAWVIMLTSYMIFQDKALSEASMYFLKILLSLSGAVMLATLPGFFDINYNIGGLTIRAAGGAAAFVFIYTQSPHIPALRATAVPYSPAPSARPGPGPTSSLGRHGDGLPLLVALSLDPSGLRAGKVDASAYTGPTTIMVSDTGESGDSGDGGESVAEPRQDTVLAGAAATASAIGEAVADAAAIVVHQARMLLDRAAEELRTAVAWVGDQMGGLVNQLYATSDSAAPGLWEFVADLPERASDTVNAAFGATAATLGEVTSRVMEIRPLEVAAPLLHSVGETVEALPQHLNTAVGDITHSLGETLELTTKTTHNLVTGILQSPGETVALTGEAVGTLAKGVIHQTRDVVATTRELTENLTKPLTQTLNDTITTPLTQTLNEVAPKLVARIDPDFAPVGRLADELGDTVGKLSATAGDVTAALPPLSSLNVGGKLDLPQPALRAGPVGERFNESAEIHGGCSSCLLPPLNVAAGLRDGAGALSRLGGKLSGGRPGASGPSGGGSPAGGGSVASAAGPAEPAGSGGASAPSGAGPAQGGPVSSLVNRVGAGTGRLTRGLLGRR